MTTVCGTGIGNGGGATPLPSDPVGSMPLTAIAGFGGINVRWTMPGINAHALAHTLLFRGTSGNFAATAQVAVVSGNSYYDRIDEAGTYYYWIRPVSVNGTVGDLYGPASATIRTMSDAIMDQITGRISDGVLATSLRATLDNISMINANLNAEIFDRETGETSFAQALEDVSNGIAEAHSFITTEINSRVTADSAIAEQIDLVAVTLGGQVAAVVISADAWIGPHATLNGKVSDIGALWTAKVTVNGLIGGFGVYNDGNEVEAGFEVDRFWIGRTANLNGSGLPGVPRQLPFMIDGGVVYIDKARIRNADIDTLKIADNAVTVPATGTTACTLVLAYPGKVYATANLWVYETSGSTGGLVTSAFSFQIDCYAGTTTGGTAVAAGGYCITHTATGRHASSTTAVVFDLPAGTWTFGSHLIIIDGAYTVQGGTIMAMGAMK